MLLFAPSSKSHPLNPNFLRNDRPVSNLTFLPKFTEKIVFSQLLDHLKTNNPLDPHQLAYRIGNNTKLLMKVVNDLLTALDNGNISVPSLLDLSAVVDTIDHKSIFFRLESSYGISDTALAWFRSFLIDCSQTVSVNGRYPPSIPLKYGVHQNSVLGPVLFVLYTKPVSAVIHHHSLLHESFADDT